jgi:hypothetical protein
MAWRAGASHLRAITPRKNRQSYGGAEPGAPTSISGWQKNRGLCD